MKINVKISKIKKVITFDRPTIWDDDDEKPKDDDRCPACGQPGYNGYCYACGHPH